MNATTQSTATGIEPRERAKMPHLEKQAMRVPGEVFVWAAGISILGSLAMELVGARRARFGLGTRAGELGLFVGQWAPTLLLLGIYKKLSQANPLGSGGSSSPRI